jgi:hypothetical protein
MTWQHYSRLIQAKSTSTQAWRIANQVNVEQSIDMLALAIHESKAHDVAVLIQALVSELNDVGLDIHRCDFCGEVMEHYDHSRFEGYLCPHCDAHQIAQLTGQPEQRWRFEERMNEYARTLFER